MTRIKILIVAGLLLCNGCLHALMAESPTNTIGPPDKVEKLRAQLDQTYPFIVRFSDDADIATERAAVVQTASKVDDLDIINGVAVFLQVSRAFELAKRPGIRQVWYLNPELAPIYVRTIRALDHNVKTLPLPTVANISLGPPVEFWSEQPYADEPMHAATRAAAEAGLIPVIAIGNNPRAESPDNSNGIINPWSWPTWVICVGAYDGKINKAASFSVRGDPDRPETWPDVIAQGVDVIGPFPTHLQKSAQRKKYDEGNDSFRAIVPREKWDLYTLESGTSQAAAHVTGASAQVIHFLKGLIAEVGARHTNRPILSLTIPPDRLSKYDDVVPRLTGTATPQADGSVLYEYKLDEPWKMLKQLLIDTATPISGANPHEIGAGLVDPAYVQQLFGKYGLVDIKIYSSKVSN
jgi:hypothetical protein